MENATGEQKHKTAYDVRDWPISWQSERSTVIAKQEPPEPNHDQHGNKNTDEGGEDRVIARQSAKAAERQADYAEFGLWVGAVAALATAWAAWAAATAAKSAAASNEIARETAKRELRAYINITQVRVDGLEGDARFCLEYKNCGQTPAYDIRGWNGIELRDIESTQIFESTGNDAGLGVLGPGNSAYFIKPAPRRLVMKEFDMLRAGEAAIYLWGEISYRDIFGEWHTTRFRYFIGGRHGVQPDRRMEYCDDGNEAD